MSGDRQKTGLFFGSFNPIHLGHLMIASYMVEFTDIREVWFIISPHNPLKEKTTLLPGANRLYMVNIAVEDEPKFRSSNIEFHLPQPSYTIDTLNYMQEKYPAHEFIILAGTDILPTLHKWKKYQQLLTQYRFYIYPRRCEERSDEAKRFSSHSSFTFVPAPLIGISSSFIRNAIRESRNMQYFLPDKVWKYIDEMGFYK